MASLVLFASALGVACANPPVPPPQAATQPPLRVSLTGDQVAVIVAALEAWERGFVRDRATLCLELTGRADTLGRPIRETPRLPTPDTLLVSLISGRPVVAPAGCPRTYASMFRDTLRRAPEGYVDPHHALVAIPAELREYTSASSLAPASAAERVDGGRRPIATRAQSATAAGLPELLPGTYRVGRVYMAIGQGTGGSYFVCGVAIDSLDAPHSKCTTRAAWTR